jgi:hypothetical protein
MADGVGKDEIFFVKSFKSWGCFDSHCVEQSRYMLKRRLPDREDFSTLITFWLNP